MILKIGSRGKEVKELQEFLNTNADGIFGVGTKALVQKWQANNNLVADGIVGPATWDAMGLATTDASEKVYTTDNGLVIHRHFLPVGEYKQGPINAEWLFLHHTAGYPMHHRNESRGESPLFSHLFEIICGVNILWSSD